MKKIVLGLLALAIIAGTYFVFIQKSDNTNEIVIPKQSKSEVESLLDRKIETFKSHGFSVKKEADHYTLTATDEQKVREYLFSEMGKDLPSSYAPIIKGFEEAITQEKTELFKGMTVDLGTVDDANGAKIEVTVKMLPSTVEKGMEADQDIQELVRKFLSKGGLSFKLAMNDKGEVAAVWLRDIDETVKVEDTVTTLKIKDAWVKAVGNYASTMVSSSGIKEIGIESKEGSNRSIALSMHDLKAHAKQIGMYDQEASAALDRVTVDIKELENSFSILFEKVDFTSFSQTKKDFLDAGYRFDTKHFSSHSVTPQGEELFGLKIDAFAFDAMVEHINLKAVEALQNMNNQNLPALLSGTAIDGDPQAAMDAVLKVMQSGLSVHINALNGESIEINMGSGMKPLVVEGLKFDLHVDLKENDLDMSMPMMYLPFIKVNGTLEMNNDDLDAITALYPMLNMISGMKKIVDRKAVFEFAYEQGHILINGTPIQ